MNSKPGPLGPDLYSIKHASVQPIISFFGPYPGPNEYTLNYIQGFKVPGLNFTRPT
ncbi:hypothetical protein D1AOALGA4SA_3983 [Olavius algarvensis Delta 1 endosymbiont]|nr:hypothetical protein D1AOALGA4SA_3983 [Olavius algarvensis Delta 1 endosymbiont]